MMHSLSYISAIFYHFYLLLKGYTIQGDLVIMPHRVMPTASEY